MIITYGWTVVQVCARPPFDSGMGTSSVFIFRIDYALSAATLTTIAASASSEKSNEPYEMFAVPRLERGIECHQKKQQKTLEEIP